MEKAMKVRVRKDRRVTIPKKVREELGWKAGTPLVVERSGDGVLLRRAPEAAWRDPWGFFFEDMTEWKR